MVETARTGASRDQAGRDDRITELKMLEGTPDAFTLKVTYDEEGLPEAEEMTAEQARAVFEHEVRNNLGMSADEFLRRWDAHEWDPVLDDGSAFSRALWNVIFMMPLVGRDAR